MAITRSKRPGSPPAAAEPSPSPKKARTGADAAPAAQGAGEPRCARHLFKSEPESRLQGGREMKFSVDDLLAEPGGVAHWDGVRNFEARNCMRRMRVGDLGFFYHSNCKKSKPGVVGVVEVVKEAYPDHTARDPDDPHYDPKSTEEDPRWYMVDVRLVRRFAGCVTLEQIKAAPELADMQLVKRGRISVQDVRDDEWAAILKLAEKMES